MLLGLAPPLPALPAMHLQRARSILGTSPGHFVKSIATPQRVPETGSNAADPVPPRSLNAVPPAFKELEFSAEVAVGLGRPPKFDACFTHDDFSSRRVWLDEKGKKKYVRQSPFVYVLTLLACPATRYAYLGIKVGNSDSF